MRTIMFDGAYWAARERELVRANGPKACPRRCCQKLDLEEILFDSIFLFARTLFDELSESN